MSLEQIICSVSVSVLGVMFGYILIPNRKLLFRLLLILLFCIIGCSVFLFQERGQLYIQSFSFMETTKTFDIMRIVILLFSFLVGVMGWVYYMTKKTYNNIP